jgi:hypothetical protein
MGVNEATLEKPHDSRVSSRDDIMNENQLHFDFLHLMLVAG